MDSINYFLAKSGDLSVKIASQSLHSSYNPRKEAERFISKIVADARLKNRKLFLIAFGLGYVEQLLVQQLKFDDFLSYDFINYAQGVYSHKNYWPRVHNLLSSQELKQELQKAIRDDNFLDYEFIIWPPARHIFTQEIALVEEHLRQIESSLYSAQHFGARWVRNAFLNTLSWEHQLSAKTTQPIVVVAPGFSLMHSMPLLKKARASYLLLALSSSVYTLKEHDLEPDLVINIDGGYYAKNYLYVKSKAPLVSASVGAWHHGASCIMVGLKSFIDNQLQQLLGNFLQLSWAGTVSYSAIELALQLTSGLVIVVGQDFELVEGLTHAKPHRHYENMLQKATRLQTFASEYYHLWQHSSKTLPMYAQWFAARTWPKRVRRLLPSSVHINISEIKAADFLSLKINECSGLELIKSPVYSLRIEALSSLLHRWEANSMLLAKEIQPMLFAAWQDAQAMGEQGVAREKKEFLEAQAQKLINQLKSYLN